MVNKFSGKGRYPKGEKYDFIDAGGKGWKLKDGETLEELKERAAGKKNGK
jgi:hypothetical protein